MRVGEKETSEQAAIIRRYADLFTEGQLDALREDEEGASGDERERLYRLRKTCEGGLIASETAEREDELENRLLAARVWFKDEEYPLRSAQAKLALLPSYADRDELGEIQAAESARFNPDRLELLRWSEELAARLFRHRRRGRAERGGEGHLAARALARPERGRRRDRGRLRPPARQVVRATARPRPRRDPDELAHGVHAAAVAARGDVPEGSRDPGLPRHAARDRLRPVAAAEHQARPRRPAAEVAARVRDRERSARGRAPDHARAGRDPRLPGVPARGRPRAPLRRLRPGAAVHVPPHLARPRADRDLLVHRRGDLQRARLARAALRADRGGGARERRGDAVHRDAALPPLRGEAPVRARLLVALPRRRRHVRRATRTR